MELIQRIIHALTQLHPLHVMLVHFPIALTSSAFFFILVALIRKSDTFEKVAWANISLAAVSTLVAGSAGIYDNIIHYNGAAPNHVAKIVLASVLLILTTTIGIVRLKNPDLFHKKLGKTIYILGYLVSFLVVIVIAFLGAVIVYGI
jgi:uncharacterized membrane protein